MVFKMSNKYVNPAKEDSQYTGTTYKCKLKTFESRPSDSHKLLLSYVLLFKYVIGMLVDRIYFFHFDKERADRHKTPNCWSSSCFLTILDISSLAR